MSDLPPPERRTLEAQLDTLQAELTYAQAANRQHEQEQQESVHYQQSQLRFRTIFEHSPLGHKIIDANLVIRQANPAVAALLGLESSLELIGHAILEFVHPDYYDDWHRLQTALWAHKTPAFTLETCLVRPDGAVCWCRVTSVLFPDEEGELGYTTLENISDRKQLEAQLYQRTHALQEANGQFATINEELQVANEELLEANIVLGKVNAELDTFVYAASHDLRAPISNLQGLVQALVHQLPVETRRAALVERILGMVHESLARFGHILDRLTDFGSAHAPEGLVREHVSLATVLGEVRKEVAPSLAATQGRLVEELAGNPTLWFAAKHVRSVLLNLVSNALKYRHPDRAPVVHVRSYYKPGQLIVSVQDNGLGLSETQQGQLFRLFQRMHAHVDGTGMGLYLVKKILDNAGGSIHVTSQVGLGSTFTAVFPR